MIARLPASGSPEVFNPSPSWRSGGQHENGRSTQAEQLDKDRVLRDSERVSTRYATWRLLNGAVGGRAACARLDRAAARDRRSWADHLPDDIPASRAVPRPGLAPGAHHRLAVHGPARCDGLADGLRDDSVPHARCAYARHPERGNPGKRIDHGHRDRWPAAQQPVRIGQHEHGWYHFVGGQVRGTLGRSERGYRPGQADRESGGGLGRVAGHRPVAVGTAVTAAGRRGRRTVAR